MLAAHRISTDAALALGMEDPGALLDEVNFALAHPADEGFDMLGKAWAMGLAREGSVEGVGLRLGGRGKRGRGWAGIVGEALVHGDRDEGKEEPRTP